MYPPCWDGTLDMTIAVTGANSSVGQNLLAHVAQNGNVDVIANSRIEIEMSRLMALKAAWSLEQKGLVNALGDIAQIKVVVPSMALNVIDRAIQMHGGTGVSEDTPLAKMWAVHRAMRLSDGPDEVHREMISRQEIGKLPLTYV